LIPPRVARRRRSTGYFLHLYMVTSSKIVVHVENEAASLPDRVDTIVGIHTGQSAVLKHFANYTFFRFSVRIDASGNEVFAFFVDFF